jgi:hypothetical protein
VYVDGPSKEIRGPRSAHYITQGAFKWLAIRTKSLGRLYNHKLLYETLGNRSFNQFAKVITSRLAFIGLRFNIEWVLYLIAHFKSYVGPR